MAALLFCQVCGASLPAQAACCTACGSSVASSCSAASWPPGFLLAQRYQILQPIGQGGFATVYKAKDRTRRNKLVAIKQIHLEGLSLQEMIDATDTYNREVVHLCALRHKNLPRIYDHFTDAQHWYIVMEYLEGKTLEEILKSARRGFLPVKRVLDIGLALCSVFYYLHTQRSPIIFRDVKPANIMITRTGHLYLIDFGIARLFRPGRKDTGPLGTPGYAAPEQYGRRAQTMPQTDIYGLGATLQTLLTGKEPLEVMREGIAPDRARTIPRRLQELLTRMLAPDATNRPRNMDEVKQRLQFIKEQSPGQKVKRAGAFLWESWKNVPTFPQVFLLVLLVLDLFSVIGFIWRLFWVLSLLLLGGIAAGRIIFRRHQIKEERSTKLSTQEWFEMVWEQVMGSFPAVLLLSVFSYFLYHLYNDWSGLDADVVILGIVAGIGILGGLFWMIAWLIRVRASHRQASPRQVQAPPLQQHIHKHP